MTPFAQASMSGPSALGPSSNGMAPCSPVEEAIRLATFHMSHSALIKSPCSISGQVNIEVVLLVFHDGPLVVAELLLPLLSVAVLCNEHKNEHKGGGKDECKRGPQ